MGRYLNKSEKILCLIPARKGSKRIPRKNIIDVNGKPMISYTIEAAINTNLFERIIVSSDDEEVQSIAKKYNVNYFSRSKKLSSDTARLDEVCYFHLMDEISKGREYDILCLLYATAPLRESKDIIKTVNLVALEGKTSSMAITKLEYPVHQAVYLNKSGNLEPMWKNLSQKRAEELPDLMIDNGSTYVVRVPHFLKQRTFQSSSQGGYIMPRKKSVDVDSFDDLKLLKFMSKL